ncbi:hypothetical protein M885DRAFT_614534 [Pelagophyceae sp. CCMP2097]|nr:hypothetical protein M885DRAFT_614534 [Pelagophyceae sp. CCMP2097]
MSTPPECVAPAAEPSSEIGPFSAEAPPLPAEAPPSAPPPYARIPFAPHVVAPYAIGAAVFVQKSKGNGGRRPFARGTIVGALVEGRYRVEYKDGSSYGIRPLNLVPIFRDTEPRTILLMSQTSEFRLAARTQPRLGDFCLEIGCDVGLATMAIQRAVGSTGSVLGIDKAKVRVEEAIERCAAKFELERPDFGVFDVLERPQQLLDFLQGKVPDVVFIDINGSRAYDDVQEVIKWASLQWHPKCIIVKSEQVVARECPEALSPNAPRRMMHTKTGAQRVSSAGLLPNEVWVVILSFCVDNHALRTRGFEAAPPLDGHDCAALAALHRVSRRFSKLLDCAAHTVWTNVLLDGSANAVPRRLRQLRKRFPATRAAHLTLLAGDDGALLAARSKDDASIARAAPPAAVPLRRDNALRLAICLPRYDSAVLNSLSQLRTIRRLDLSTNLDLTDADVDFAVQNLPSLRDLAVERCPKLSDPKAFFQYCGAADEAETDDEASQRLQLRRLAVDGCCGLSAACVARLQQLWGAGMDVDLFGTIEAPDTVEVVILSGAHEGSWVLARVLLKRGDEYDLWVLPTDRFDGAVGFSGRPALGIARQHVRELKLRKRPPDLLDADDDEPKPRPAATTARQTVVGTNIFAHTLAQ